MTSKVDVLASYWTLAVGCRAARGPGIQLG